METNRDRRKVAAHFRAPDPKRLDHLLAELSECASVTMVAARSGIHRTALCRERERSKRFVPKRDKACDLRVERLQDDAMNRALPGEVRPVYRGGEQVGEFQRHETSLLKFLLQSHRPEVYGARKGAAALPFDLVKRVNAAEKRRFRRNAQYRRDPLGFVRWAFPWGDPDGPLAGSIGPDQRQQDVLEEIGRRLEAGKGPVRVAVASGHGVGKSALIAWLMLWAGAEPSTRGVVTANTATQLITKTWANSASGTASPSRNTGTSSAPSLVSTLPGAGVAGRIWSLSF